MRNVINKRLLHAVVLSTSLGVMAMAQAHFMKAEHGTLNIKDDGVYMVLSLPASVFNGYIEHRHDIPCSSGNLAQTGHAS